MQRLKCSSLSIPWPTAKGQKPSPLSWMGSMLHPGPGLCGGGLPAWSPSQTRGVWDSGFPTPTAPDLGCLWKFHASRCCMDYSWRLQSSLRGSWLAAEFFSILMTYPDGAQGRDPPGSRVAVGPAFPFAEHLVCGFFPDGPGVIFT